MYYYNKQLEMELFYFLKSWIQWVEAGAPQSSPYSRHEGLCCSSKRYGVPITRCMRYIWFK